MPRDLTTAVETATEADLIAPLLFIFADFPGGAVRVFTGLGSIDWGGETWLGLGDLLSVDVAGESLDGSAQGATVEVSGLSNEFFSPAMLGNFQGSAATIHLGLLDTDTKAVLADPILIYEGTLDSDDITDDGQSSTIAISIEHALVNHLRPQEWRYTHEDQQTLHPGDGDKGLEFVAALQDVELKWGT